MPVILDINASEVVKFSNTLEKLHRSALPLAVRGSLNDAAKDMKLKKAGFEGTLEGEFFENFTIRKKSFIKSHTGFQSSPNTFDIDKMNSSAGVLQGKSEAGDRLELQEKGGGLDRGRIPTQVARISESKSKLVSKRHFYSKYKGKKGLLSKTKKEAIIATKKAIVRIRDGKFESIYTLNKKVTIPKKPFVEPAGLKSNRKMFRFFEKQATLRIKKLISK